MAGILVIRKKCLWRTLVDSPLEKPFRVYNWKAGDRCFSYAQVGKRTGLSAGQRALGLRRQSHCRALAYESHDDSGNWFRSYGNENWEFDENGLMRLRLASINDIPVEEWTVNITGRWGVVRTSIQIK